MTEPIANKTPLPDPEWWRAAAQMAKGGVSGYEIGRALGRTPNAVRYALDPTYREKVKAYNKPRRKPRTPEERAHLRESVRADWKRLSARQEARARWRADGCVRSLYSYYRELECL